ncbi:hypothetical protein D3Z58_11840 [Clostridiaceae bacterium]|nr:hypothetical protein [Clostridiaceae bacterium]
MASISSTSSLGNTSLRGYGGMASGIDRDAIIEQMTLGTTTKINNQETAITKLEWKQEAFRGISDKILDMHDNYFSYTSSNSLKDPNTFAKSLITVHGKEDAAKFVTATGSSDLINNVSIQAVRQIATSSVYKSDERKGELVTQLKDLDSGFMFASNLIGSQLRFSKPTGTDGETQKIVFDLPAQGKEYTVRDENGDVVKDAEGNEVKAKIDYFQKDGESDKEYGERMAKALNDYMHEASANFDSDKQNAVMSDYIEFKFDGTNMTIHQKQSTNGFELQKNSSALKGLGYKWDPSSTDTIKWNDLENNRNTGVSSFRDAAISETSTLSYLTGQKVTFNFDGNKKNIELVTKAEAEALSKMELTDAEKADIEAKFDADKDKLREEIEKKIDEDPANAGLSAADREAKIQEELDKKKEEYLAEGLDQKKLGAIAQNIQGRLDQAFGKGSVISKLNDDGKLSFATGGKTSTVSITSGDGAMLFNLGITNGESNKVNLNGNLNQTNIGIDVTKDEYKDGLVINGVRIDGIGAGTSISTILSKINSNENAGVKATYVDATGQFMLVSKETGAAREISLDSKLAQDLFGTHKEDGTLDNDAGLVKGQDAIIDVSYGNGVTVTLERSSNSFNLEGLTVNVSGTFGGDWTDGQTMSAEDAEKYTLQDGERFVNGKNGEKILQTWKADASEAVTFSAKADVDKVVEKVKKFFEEFNAIASEVNTQVTTRPDGSYGPLTDAQKEEMSETSIENWEKKAKSGLLFGDGTMRDLSMDIQSIYSKLMQQTGLSYEDLKEMGISYSDNEKDGGVLVFDEAKFRDSMESNPEKVSDFFTGGNGMGQGFTKLVEDTFTPYATRYATRNGNSYGRLIEEAGSEKIPTSIMKNQIYKEIQSKQDLIEQLRAKLVTEQDRYIAQFTTMETMINQMNSQSSWLSQITG